MRERKKEKEVAIYSFLKGKIALSAKNSNF
jgi:hypothetical protein